MIPLLYQLSYTATVGLNGDHTSFLPGAASLYQAKGLRHDQGLLRIRPFSRRFLPFVLNRSVYTDSDTL